MKHEFRATLRLMIPLFLVTLALALGARVMAALSWNAANGIGWNMPNYITIMIYMGATLSLVVVPVMTVVLMIIRFRSNLMADEGYVMFTLPVSRHQLVWSKLLVSLVWLAGAAIVDILAMIIMSAEYSLWGDVKEFAGNVYAAYQSYPGDAVLLTIELVLLAVIGCFVFCLRFYAPLAIGHSFARHKMLLSVVFYFVISVATEMVIGVFLIFGLDPTGFWFSTFSGRIRIMLSEMSATQILHTGMWFYIIVLAIYGVILYCITLRMLNKRLNLE